MPSPLALAREEGYRLHGLHPGPSLSGPVTLSHSVLIGLCSLRMKGWRVPFCLSKTGFDFNPRVQRLSELEVRLNAASHNTCARCDGHGSFRMTLPIPLLSPCPPPPFVPLTSQGKSRLRLAFHERLVRFWELQGEELRHFPVVDGQPLDFYRLHEVRVGLRRSPLHFPCQSLPSFRFGSLAPSRHGLLLLYAWVLEDGRCRGWL